jgi:hypothetical protein
MGAPLRAPPLQPMKVKHAVTRMIAAGLISDLQKIFVTTLAP